MLPFPALSLPLARLDLRKTDDQYWVKCLIRKKWIVLTPEEWVRQHLIYFLLNQLNIPTSFISVEKTIHYGQLVKRWDILVFSKSHTPFMLIECKAPNITLSIHTLFQLFTYQNVVQGKYLAISNGIDHKFYTTDSKGDNKLVEISNFPTWD
jgi:hypothetical protein